MQRGCPQRRRPNRTDAVRFDPLDALRVPEHTTVLGLDLGHGLTHRSPTFLSHPPRKRVFFFYTTLPPNSWINPFTVSSC